MNKKTVGLTAIILLISAKSAFGDGYKLPTLIQWTSTCLHIYDERFDGSRFFGTPALKESDFNQALDLFFKKFKETGIFKEWAQGDQQKTIFSQDFKSPYVSTLEAAPHTIVCFTGDLHGSLHSLLRNLWRLVALGYLDKNFKITRKNFDLVFLGDYVDRGGYGAEVLYTLLRLKCASWNNVYLIRGNHEVKDMNARSALDGGGFWHELQVKYPSTPELLFSKICNFYQHLPLALYITSNKQTIMAAHGGFGPYSYYYDNHMKKSRIKHISLKEEDLISPAFQWCDIVQRARPQQENKFIHDSERVWRVDVQGLMSALAKSRNLALFRGHQHGAFGLKMLFKPENSSHIISPRIDLDTSSTQYHWTKVVQQTNPSDLSENNTRGFKIDRYAPIFTFSSAPEGVLEPYDCFGLLGMEGAFAQWRLKVFEFDSPLNRNQTPDHRFYTIISKDFRRAKKSTSGMPDVIWPRFERKPRTIKKITKELILI